MDDDQDMLRVAEQNCRRARWAVLGSLVFAISPLIPATIASLVASAYGKRLNEADSPDIPVIGDLLYSMFVTSWFAMITIPIGAIFLLFSLLSYGIALRERLRVRRLAASTPEP